MLTLTAENFDEAKNSKDGYLVEFYAPWCGACKAFSPELGKAATALKGITPVGAIDGTENRELMSTYGAKGYPTVIFFKGGEFSEYTGARTSEKLVNWVKRRSQGLLAVSTLAELPDLGANPPVDGDTTVIGVFPKGGESSEEGKVFLKAALADDNREYVTCSNDDEAKRVCGGKTSCVALRSPLRTESEPIIWHWKVRVRILDLVFDFHSLTASEQVASQENEGGTSTLGALQKFIGIEEFPTVVDFTPPHARVVLGAWHNRTAWLFAAADSPLATWFRTFASEHRSKALFVIVEKDDRLKKIVGLEDVAQPAFGMTRRRPGSSNKLWVYPLEKDLQDGSAAESAIAEQFNGVMGGMAPKLKSAEPPADNSGSLKVVVGSTFESFRKTDLFLKVYAPWCGHCKKMAPMWSELADAYAEDQDVTIAKMDGTVNEVDQLEVKGYPTLVYFPVGSSEPVTFKGKRNVEAFKEFIEASRTKKTPQ